MSTRDTPRPFTAAGPCAVEAGDAEGKKLASFRGVAYTGAAMRPGGWWGKVIIDLAGVNVPSQGRPVLRQHDHEKIVGHTSKVKVDRDGIHIEGTFSGEKHHVDSVVVPAKNGFNWNLSVGANPVRTEFLEAGEDAEVNGRTVTGPLTISRETDLGEISFVPLGADPDTSVSVAARQGLPATSAGHRQATPLIQRRCQRHLERLQVAQRRGEVLYHGVVVSGQVETVLADIAAAKGGALAVDQPGDCTAFVVATRPFPTHDLGPWQASGLLAGRLILRLLGDGKHIIVPRAY